MNNSVILQVDESTKGLMEEIQSGISSSIEDGMREVKNKVDAVDGNTDMILRKFKNFDGISSSVEQLRTLAEESKKFAAIVSPLESSVSELKQGSKSQEQTLSQITSNVSLLVKGVVELGDKENTLASEIKANIKNVLDCIESGDNNTNTRLNDVLQKLSQAEIVRQEISAKINSSLTSIKESVNELSLHIDDNSIHIESSIGKVAESQAEFSIKYAENETAHKEFENKTTTQIENLNQSLEKIQATLDIVVNLVTPFWKKW